jgi:hypothetical protein
MLGLSGVVWEGGSTIGVEAAAPPVNAKVAPAAPSAAVLRRLFLEVFCARAMLERSYAGKHSSTRESLF